MVPMGPSQPCPPDYSGGYPQQPASTAVYSAPGPNMQSDATYSSTPALMGFEQLATGSVGSAPSSFHGRLATPVQNYGPSSTVVGTGVPLTSPYGIQWQQQQQGLTMSQQRIWPSGMAGSDRRTSLDIPAQHDRPTNITNFALTSGSARQTAEDIKDVKKLIGKSSVPEGKRKLTANAKPDVEVTLLRLHHRQISEDSGTDKERIKNVKKLLKEYNIMQVKDERIVRSRSDVQELGRCGLGEFGSISRIRHRRTNRQMAMKTFYLHKAEDYKRFLREFEILPAIKCEYISEFFGAFLNSASLHFITELMDLPIREVQRAIGFVPEAYLSWIAFSVLHAVRYLEKEVNTLHRDIRPEHILANLEGQVKLCDFGVSCNTAKGVAGEFCGPILLYMSPERIQRRPYSVLAEVWSIGITLAELGTGRYPYRPATDKDTTRLVKMVELLRDDNYEELRKLAFDWNSGKVREPTRFIPGLYDYIVEGPSPILPEDLFGNDVSDFIGQCLKKEASERANIDSLMSHTFLSAAVSSHGESRRLFASFVAKIVKM